MDFSDFKYEKVWVDSKNNLLARLFDVNTSESKIFNFGKKFIPSLYVENDDPSNVYSSYTNGKKLKEIEFEDSYKLYNFIKENPNAYGYNNRPHKFIREMSSDTLGSDHEFHEWFLDIETRSNLGGFPRPEAALEEVTMIQIYDSKAKKYFILGRKEYTEEFDQENVQYLCIPSEKDLLNTFLKLLNKLKPVAIKTFNGLLFDFPYLTNRIKNLKLDYEALSPIREIKFNDAITQDGMAGVGVSWEGIYLIDLRELFLKYAYAGLASNSLDSVSKHYGFEGKINHSEFDTFDGTYSGKGYIFPKDPPPLGTLDHKIYQTQLEYKNDNSQANLEKMEQACFNKFVNYSVKDVELMVKIEDKAKLFDKAKGIAYTCGVNMDEVMGTLKQWKAFVYNECYKNNIILPLAQHYGDENCIYKAGWTTSRAGKYNWVASFDFTSLYPSLFQAFNVGTDVMVKPEELEEMPELKEIKMKYFYYFTPEYAAKTPGYDENDNIEETKYYMFLLENKDHITPILKKYDITATPNGQFFRRQKESVSSVLMRRIFAERVKHKRSAQRLYGEIEDVKSELKIRGFEV